MSTLSTLRELLPGLLFGLLLTALVLGPSLLAGGLLGHQNLDNWSHAWGMRWFVDSLAHGRLPWRITGAAFPEQRVLWYADPMGALLSAPLQLLSPATAYNGLQVLQLTLLGLCSWGFARALGGRGWLAAAAMVSLPLLQTELHNGVVEACWMAPIAATGWLAAKNSKWTGVAMGAAAIGTPYHGMGAALIGATLLAMGGTQGRGGWRARLAMLAGTGALALALALPHYLLMAHGFDSPQAFVNRPLFDGFNDPSMRINATDPRALWTWGEFWSRPPDMENVLSAPWKHTPYLGWLLTLSAGVGVYRERRLAWLLLPASVAVIASLGFFLWWEGAWLLTEDGRKYTLPLYWVSRFTQVSLGHHMRFAATTAMVLAVLADRAFARWAWVPVPLVLAEHLLLAPGAWPIPTSPSALPQAFAQLAHIPGAVIDLPADSGHANRTNRYLYWNTLHHRPVPWVNKVGSQGTASMNPALRRWVLLSKEGPVVPGSPGVPAADADYDAAVAQLSGQGFGLVILHTELLAEPRLEGLHRRVLSAQLGPPMRVEGGWAWVIPR